MIATATNTDLRPWAKPIPPEDARHCFASRIRSTDDEVWLYVQRQRLEEEVS